MSSQSNKVRIIAGKWRGRKVDFLSTAQLRPTGDKIRETAFNWLQPHILDAHCLDLFSGSGIFGFESLSRGAKLAVMVDQDPKTIAKIQENAHALSAENYQLWRHSIPSEPLVQKLKGQSFDVVFIDPPFGQGLVEPTCSMLEQAGVLKDGALIYVETEREGQIHFPSTWEVLRAKTSGNVAYYLVEVIRAQ